MTNGEVPLDDPIKDRAQQIVLAIQEFTEAQLTVLVRTPVGSDDHVSLDRLENAMKALLAAVERGLRAVAGEKGGA